MNESNADATLSKEEQQESSPLKALQDILRNRIKQKKREVHESNSMVYNQNLWREIETLNWVLAQILTFRRIYDFGNRNNNNR
jgi:hypothetical protein